jgi:hypothetical protein
VAGALAAIGYTHVPHADDAFCPFFHRAHPEALAVYASLKHDLAGRFGGNSFESRNAYAAAKSVFIEDAIRRALAEGLPHEL